MKAMLIRSVVAMLGVTLGLCVDIAHADITFDSSTSVEGVGAMALGNMTGTSRTIIAGDKSRTDSDMKMQSSIVGFLARNAVGPSAEIILLDQDKLYHLNVAKKEYTEASFEQMRAQMQKMSEQTTSNPGKQQPSVVDQSKCQWLPPKVAVNKSGEKAQFAGYDADRMTITASQPCEDKETGSICEVALVLDEWMAPAFNENAEVRKFYSAYMSKMGMTQSVSQEALDRAKLVFSQYQGIWTEIASKMKDVKGYAVKTSFTLALGGAQCKDSNAQPARPSQSDDTSAMPGGIAGTLAGSLGGLFHKNRSVADAPAAQPTPAVTPVVLPAGDVALMTISSQLISVSTNAVNADAFTVPADFKKLEFKMQ